MESQDKKKYLHVIISAYVLIAIITYIKSGIPTNSIQIGSLIGGGIGIALIPLLIMRFVGAKGAWVAFVIFSLGYTQDQLNWLKVDNINANDIHQYTFKAKDCDFATNFPSKPIVKIYTHPDTGDYEEATWVKTISKESIVLKTECLKIPNLKEHIANKNLKEFMLNQLSIYSKNNGLSSTEYNYELKSLGSTGHVRGIKYIQDIPITYEIIVIIGENSLISLKAGGNSSTYPQKVITPFLSSASIIAHSNP